MNNKDITVILLLYNTSINVINNLKVYESFKLLILDQSNDYNLKKKIKKFLPNIKYYKISSKNLGFAKGVNFLTSKVKTKYFLCTQPDVIISKKDILNLKKSFLLKNDCIVSIPTFNKKNKKNKKFLFRAKSFIGAIFLSDTKKFIKFKGFDGNFFFYWEDIDFMHRVNLSEYNIYVNILSKAKHLFGKSTKPSFKNFFLKNSNFKFGEYLYQYKHKKLKIIKLLREPILIILKSLYNLITLNKISLYKNFSHFFGILKFYIYLFKNNY